ncbi:MAG: glycosyltransferase [Clostridiales bacterium]|nr:glycosyltransferase [Clostridiales bacterium]
MNEHTSKNPMVTIIIPVYNVENYLRRCVDSVLSQEYTDFEVFLVDNGSTDSSGIICDEYAGEDARVRVIHQKNTGVSDARNAAIAEARGTWIQFADSDDWITPDATRQFVKAATENNCDMVISDFYRVAGERFSQKGDIDKEGLLTREEYASCMMENPADFYYGVLWNKFFRRELIDRYALKMDTSVNWCEDFLFNLEYILHVESIYVLPAPTYYYRRRRGSLASQGMSISKTINMKMMVFEYYNEFYKKIYDEKDYNSKRMRIYSFLLDAAGDSAVAPAVFSGSQKLKKERYLLVPETAAGDDFFAELYRGRKLLEHYMKAAARRHNLTVSDGTVLLYLSRTDGICTRKEIADFTGISRSTVNRSLQKLSSREYIKITDVHVKGTRKNKEAKASNGRKIHVVFLPSCENILGEISDALKSMDAVRFEGFTQEERDVYDRVLKKMKENMMRALR